ncbi:hypothetical protein EDB92DRAFT_459215 [Lactarius akahatsu]|uniref:Secreted protein n=1 Tax=Lactarius akahatsu TaxID=416441 RepID=A0AAD4L3K8_9AGAM|nr:hypothetical protein EDB92DRAFT_459215 [Lactarius akahatsu]
MSLRSNLIWCTLASALISLLFANAPRSSCGSFTNLLCSFAGVARKTEASSPLIMLTATWPAWKLLKVPRSIHHWSDLYIRTSLGAGINASQLYIGSEIKSLLLSFTLPPTSARPCWNSGGLSATSDTSRVLASFSTLPSFWCG